MAYQLPNLVWLRSFEAAARLGSFTAAAAELGLTQAAVSHQVRALEGKLGFPLFIRRARSLELTEMGRAYIPSVRKAIEDLALATQGLFGPKMRKVLTVRAPISTAVLWLAPRLKQFREDRPGIHVRLISAIWADGIFDEDVDIDIRLGNGAWPGCHAELLSNETVVPICAAGMERELASVSDLRGKELVHILGFQDHWARFFTAAGVEHDQRNVGTAVDTSLAAVEIVTSRGGVALIMKRYADDLVASGRVSVPFARELPLGQSHYLVTASGAPPPSAEATFLKQRLVRAFGC